MHSISVERRVNAPRTTVLVFFFEKSMFPPSFRTDSGFTLSYISDILCIYYRILQYIPRVKANRLFRRNCYLKEPARQPMCLRTSSSIHPTPLSPTFMRAIYIGLTLRLILKRRQRLHDRNAARNRGQRLLYSQPLPDFAIKPFADKEVVCLMLMKIR